MTLTPLIPFLTDNKIHILNKHGSRIDHREPINNVLVNWLLSVPWLKCHKSILRALAFLASVKALLKYSGRREPCYTLVDIRTVHYSRIKENPTFRGTLLSWSCIFKRFQFQDCYDDDFMHLIYACSIMCH